MLKNMIRPKSQDSHLGGMMGCLAILGGFLVLFCSWGFTNTFGVFQAYYQFVGYPGTAASKISWIGSVQLFLQFSLGAVSGPLFDRGYFYYLIIGGNTVYIISLFMTSLCTQYWQVMLAQGVGVGIGAGLIFTPALSVLSQYWVEKRGVALGITISGTAVGGVALPIMLNNLITSIGFPKAVRATAYLILGCLVVSTAIVHPRLPTAKIAPPRPGPRQIFSTIPYAILTSGLFFSVWGVFPLYYLQVYAETHGLSQNLSFYTLAISNAAGIPGRIVSSFLSNRFGPLRLVTIFGSCSGILCFAVFGAGSPGGLITVSILFGFFSGAANALFPASLMSLAKSQDEIGTRVGMGFLVMSFAALTGTPITDALLDRYGFAAPIAFSGVVVLAGAAIFGTVMWMKRKEQGTWKV